MDRPARELVPGHRIHGMDEPVGVPEHDGAPGPLEVHQGRLRLTSRAQPQGEAAQPGRIVHHVDGDPLNNQPENLIILIGPNTSDFI